ncbi:hypothetical protein J6590_105430, partial [Homalodisca vitripennis]
VIDSHYSIGQPRSCQTRDSSGCKAERPTNKSVNYGGMECAYVFVDSLDLIYTRTICFYSVWRLYINLPPALSPVAYHHAACCAGSKVVSRPHFTNKNAKQSTRSILITRTICFYSVWRLYINLPPALSPVAYHHAACCAGSKVVSRPHFTNKNAKQSTRWILYILGQYVSI